jgi:hypothetical protein
MELGLISILWILNMGSKVGLFDRLNPIRWLLTKAQREGIYGDRTQQEIAIPQGFKLIEFMDEEKKKHRFLYKAPEKGQPSNMFFGGSELNVNTKNYKSFLSEMANMPSGFIVPIYPGYHEANVEPSEDRIQDSCLKIFNALNSPKDYKFSQDGEEIILENPTLKMNLIGYSLGAPIAAEIAEQDNNQKIDNLTLMAPPASIRDYSIEMASAGQSPRVGKIFNFFSKGFGEKYSTVDSLRKLDEKVDLTIITSDRGQFNQARANRSESQSHLEEIKGALEGNNRYSIVQVDGVSHNNFLNNAQIRDKLKGVCCRQELPKGQKTSVIEEALVVSPPVVLKKYHVIRNAQRTM